MDALISGQAGAAAILGRDGQIRRVGEAPLPHLPQHLLGRFFAGSTDIQRRAVASIYELDAITQRAWSSDRALRMFLMLIDPSEPEDAVDEYAACLEELLAEPEAEVFVRKNMYSKPLPASVDTVRTAAIVKGHAKSSGLFERLIRDQSRIAQVRNSFDAVSPELLDEPKSKSMVLEAAIMNGAFVDLVDALRGNADVNLIVLKLLAQLRHVRGSREVVERWTSEMRKPASTPTLVPELAEESDPLDESRFVAVLDQALANIQQRKRRSKGGSSADLAGIKREISWIGARLKSGDTVGAEQALGTLIERQGRRSRMEDIVKTLTAVADLARDAKLFDFTLRMIAGIERIGSLDSAAANVRAETLRDLGRYEEALAAFEDTMRRYPSDEVAPTARAETLRELGRYEEALAAFEDTMRRFPQDEVAPNASAETLRDLGRYQEALAAFEDTMRRFPQNEVAPTARAETLRELGRYEGALAAFEDTMRRFPQNEVARNARAETLRDLGRYEEALAAFEDTMRRFPQNEVAPNARAETLLDLGRYEEALAALEDTMRRFPYDEVAPNVYAHFLGSRGTIAKVEELLAPAVARLRTKGDWVAAHILAMARLRAGRVDEALADIERGVKYCTYREQHRYFETARPLALLAKRQAAEAARQLENLAAISSLPREEKTNIVLFQAHALAEAGEFHRARNIVESAQIVDFAAARQRKLAEAITERYGLVSGVPASAGRAEELSGTISMLEFDLVRPKLWTFRASAVRAA
jgi:tetratricopeptide (TPR) repeat protein